MCLFSRQGGAASSGLQPKELLGARPGEGSLGSLLSLVSRLVGGLTGRWARQRLA